MIQNGGQRATFDQELNKRRTTCKKQIYIILKDRAIVANTLFVWVLWYLLRIFGILISNFCKQECRQVIDHAIVDLEDHVTNLF